MKKPDQDLIQLLAESATSWMDQKRVEHTSRFRAAFQDAFEAGWHARDEVKRFHHEAEVESVKKEVEKLETLLLDLGEEKDNMAQKAIDLETKLNNIKESQKRHAEETERMIAFQLDN